LRLVGVAEDADQAIEIARTHLPDVAILDVKMPGGGGPRAAQVIRSCSPGTAIIALSAHEDQRSITEMMAGGAGSYLLKGTSTRAILDAVRGSASWTAPS
jgi:DNA-binding NarL/FixJ family response regulator